MAYRFVHAADIHLDSPLRSLALRDPDLAELIGNATRHSLIAIVDLCLAEQVDALLLAGDLYDGEQTSMKTARFIAEQMRRLHEADIKVFVIRGNHDAMSKITRELTLPECVKVFGGRAEAVSIDCAEGGIPVAIHGLSFAQPHAPESLLPRYGAPVEGAVNIGLMHTSLAGAAGHDPYAPCTLADLQKSGFRYWALGHVHKRSVVEGACTIVMPGMPQGRDINEAGAKSVSLVSIGDDRTLHIEERITSCAQFERVEVDLSGIDDWPDMLGAAEKALARSREVAICGHLVARLRLSGETPLAWRLRRDPDLLKAETDDRASLIGQCWIEKIEMDCQAPGLAARQTGNPVLELRRLIGDDILVSPAFQNEMAKIADELNAQLPPECRSILGADEQQSRDVIAALAREGAEDVLAWLQAAAGARED